MYSELGARCLELLRQILHLHSGVLFSSCALCFLVAGLNLPPEAVVVDLRSWLLDELQFIERESLVASIDTITFHLGRAPPAA